MTQPLSPCGGYHAGHPWYYRLGGAIPSPKQIKAEVESKNYRGYLARRIDAAAAKSEPQRSESLRALREKVLEDLRKDLSRYRECAQELRRFRRAGDSERDGSTSASRAAGKPLRTCPAREAPLPSGSRCCSL